MTQERHNMEVLKQREYKDNDRNDLIEREQVQQIGDAAVRLTSES